MELILLKRQTSGEIKATVEGLENKDKWKLIYAHVHVKK